jgi:hypothetical protein
MIKNILITKNSGEQVNFEEGKLRLSLQRAGANQSVIDKVIAELELYLQSGMSTHKVYKKAYSILSKLSHGSAGRYRLKKAIMELGPTGYPFEKFVGAIFKYQGFDVNTGQLIDGKCVQHEVDVVAENENTIVVVECKFHRDGNRKSDVKVPLYIRSRFNDIYNKWKEDGVIGKKNYEAWVVTNTRFTTDAEKFGDCSGLKMVSWDYPNSNSLRNMVDKAGLHPITSLKNLTKKEKQRILESGIVLCREITKEVLQNNFISQKKIAKVLFESDSLVNMK